MHGGLVPHGFSEKTVDIVSRFFFSLRTRLRGPSCLVMAVLTGAIRCVLHLCALVSVGPTAGYNNISIYNYYFYRSYLGPFAAIARRLFFLAFVSLVEESRPGVSLMGRKDRLRSHSVNDTEPFCRTRRRFEQSGICGSL